MKQSVISQRGPLPHAGLREFVFGVPQPAVAAGDDAEVMAETEADAELEDGTAEDAGSEDPEA